MVEFMSELTTLVRQYRLLCLVSTFESCLQIESIQAR
jgi:hypothetical protein